jgi:ribonuclease J
MARIKIFALGGLGENGKNLYCVDVDEQLFLLDAGLKYPGSELYGVDSIIPDFSYLEVNKQRIAGLFLSHGHEDHIGAVPKLLKTIKIPVYGSHFTLALLKDSMEDQGMNVDEYKMFKVDGSKPMMFQDVRVEFFRTTHSIPESMGISIVTKDGAIVYAPDYTFDQNTRNSYKTDFKQLSRIANNEILCLMTESLGCEQTGSSKDIRRLDHMLNQAFNQAQGRIIVSAFSTDLNRIQHVIDVALQHDRDIAIIGRRTQRTVDIAINLGYLKIPKQKLINLRFIDENNENALPNAVVFVTGDRHEPFYMLQRMVKKVDKLIHVKGDDTVLMLTPPIPGTERIAARTLDILYRHDVNVVKISKNDLPPSHAGAEDIKLLVNFLNPRYVIPIIGEYRHQYALKNVVMTMGYDAKQILMLDNGQMAEINNKKVVSLAERLDVSDILVDGSLEGDVGDVVLRDRELLAEDGVILLIANINSRTRKILTDPEVVSRGFIYMKDNDALINGISEQFLLVAANELQGKYINWKSFKQQVKKRVSNYVYRQTKRSPIIIPVIIDTQTE